MNHIQPGVYIEHQTISMAQPEMATAVPVFIGYTGKTETAQQLHKINTLADYEKTFLDTNGLDLGKKYASAHSPLYNALQHYFEVGGDPCFVLSVGKRNSDAVIDNDTIMQNLTEAAKSNALTKEPTITLMAMPDLALLDEQQTTAQQWADVYNVMLSTCQKHNWFALLDSPAEIKRTEELAKLTFNTHGEYGAAYWPRLQVNDSATPSSEPTHIPPSAAVAAMMQRIDQDRGIWKAPANVALPQVITPQHLHWQAQNLFNPQGSSINVIRCFAGRGVRVWGCRTLADGTQAQRQYIQTRRLLTYIESNVTEMARFATFEPNNAITWVKLKGLTQAWLRQLWFQGGLFGATEEEAFRVLIGLGETMTQADIRAGTLIMRVCVAPLYPAEFIDITLQFYTNEGKVTQRAPQASQQTRSMSA